MVKQQRMSPIKPSWLNISIPGGINVTTSMHQIPTWRQTSAAFAYMMYTQFFNCPLC